MNIDVASEIISLRKIKLKVQWFGEYCGSDIAPYISCATRESLCIDIYSWERSVSGISNAGPDWDPDEHYEKMLVIPFERNREGFRKAFGLARLCVGKLS